MRGRKSIALFVPESLGSDGSLWRRYVISHAAVNLRHKGGTASGEIYLFDTCCVAYSGFVRCAIPKIFPGCAVLEGAEISGETEASKLPEGCIRVLSAERFDGGTASHVKLSVG